MKLLPFKIFVCLNYFTLTPNCNTNYNLFAPETKSGLHISLRQLSVLYARAHTHTHIHSLLNLFIILLSNSFIISLLSNLRTLLRLSSSYWLLSLYHQSKWNKWQFPAPTLHHMVLMQWLATKCQMAPRYQLFKNNIIPTQDICITPPKG